MTSQLSVTAHFAALSFVLLAPFLPLPLAFRAVALSAVAYAAGELLAGAPHWSNGNIGSALLWAATLFLVTIAGVVLAVRLVITAFRGRLTPERLLDKSSEYRSVDAVLLGVTGAVAGLAIAVCLAAILGGTSGGLALDIGIAVVAGGAAAFLLRPAGGRSPFLVCTALAVTAVAFVGLFQTVRIVEEAEVFARGRPWCLVSPTPGIPVSSHGQLGFFSLPRIGGSGHLEVLVRDGDSFAKAHWSIRQQSFVPNRHASGSTCHPRQDYASALSEGRVDPSALSTVFGLHTVPPSMAPDASIDGLSVRSGFLVGEGGTYPQISQTIRMKAGTSSPRVPDRAMPISSLSALGSDDIPELTSGRGRYFSGTDPATGYQVAVECLHGAFADRTCAVTASGPTVSYEFMIPFAEVASWSTVLAQVETLFAGMRVAD